MTSWQPTPLGEVLSRSDEIAGIQPDESYKEITVKLWGKGVILRGITSGANFNGSRRFLARKGQLIVSRIDARNGAIGLVPEALDGSVVSTDFPLFRIDTTRVLPGYLDWLTKTKSFVELCQQASEGTTNRVRLQEDRFLQLELSLPPLLEQRRIVARIEELAAKINEARSLRQQSSTEATAWWPNLLREILVGKKSLGKRDEQNSDSARNLLAACAKRHADKAVTNYNNAHPHKPEIIERGPVALPASWVWTTLGSVLTHLIDCINDTPDFSDYDTGLIGLKSTNIRPYQLDLSQRWFMTSDSFAYWNRRETPRHNDIVLTREAPMGHACLLPPEHELCLTQRLLLLRADTETVLPKLLLHYLNSPYFRQQVEDKCRGLTTPHIRVQDAPEFLMPLPPMTQQNQILAELDDLQAKVDTLKKLQSDAAVELDALAPSILDKAFRGDL
jgi:type I restriction enzyme S subunit